MDRTFLLFGLLAIVCSTFTVAVCNTDVPREFLDALREIESVGAGGVCAVGDSGRSLGAYQIMNSHYTEAVLQNASLSDGGIVKLSPKFMWHALERHRVVTNCAHNNYNSGSKPPTMQACKQFIVTSKNWRVLAQKQLAADP